GRGGAGAGGRMNAIRRGRCGASRAGTRAFRRSVGAGGGGPGAGVPVMRAVDIIRKKRDGHALSPAELAAMIEGIASGQVADYQWAALLMAIVWRGMDAAETAALTEAMVRSG